MKNELREYNFEGKKYFWKFDLEIKTYVGGLNWIEDNSKRQYINVFNADKKLIDYECGTTCMHEENTKANIAKLVKEIEDSWLPSWISENDPDYEEVE